MHDDFEQIEWCPLMEEECRRLAALAFAEDFADGVDHTAEVSVGPDAMGAASVVVREAGVVAGLLATGVLIDEFGGDVGHAASTSDGHAVAPGTRIAHLEGRVRDILAIERTLLNFLGRLSGIASLTRQFVDAVAGTGARIYDTRKTTPGWRRLEKYAVRCGGGYNHRLGLFAAILIKDNHVAAYQAGQNPCNQRTLATLTQSARDYAERLAGRSQRRLLVEVEVDSLEQLEDVLGGGPDLLLLDNMDVATLRQAVAIRDELRPDMDLEASGGVTLANVGQIAATGVERISVGALTHQAGWLDIGLDWLG